MPPNLVIRPCLTHLAILNVTIYVMARFIRNFVPSYIKCQDLLLGGLAYGSPYGVPTSKVMRAFQSKLSVASSSTTTTTVDVVNIGWGRWYNLCELETATRGFCEENVIGEGDNGVVYKGVLEDGSIVAVKKFLNNKYVSCFGFSNVCHLIHFDDSKVNISMMLSSMRLSVERSWIVGLQKRVLSMRLWNPLEAIVAFILDFGFICNFRARRISDSGHRLETSLSA
ncbi:hypothetical protein RND81_03G015900 [Saponaria officinalis]|uniref:non-specific serine/threonine protein kinase n=1 Tax=Saponaria officinalis TaxID=3572 RepID=A0AAW1M4K0_SAPOF